LSSFPDLSEHTLSSFVTPCIKMDDLDDLDLDALMGELEAVQEEVTGNRLAERSCIEIMMKLISKNQLDVLYTLGKIYISSLLLFIYFHCKIQNPILIYFKTNFYLFQQTKTQTSSGLLCYFFESQKTAENTSHQNI